MEKVPHPNQFLICLFPFPFSFSFPILSYPRYAMQEKKTRGYAERKKKLRYANYGIPCNSSSMKSRVNEKSSHPVRLPVLPYPVCLSKNPISLRTKILLLLLQISTSASMTENKRAFTVSRDFVASGSRGDGSPDSFAID